jgi:N-acetylmuramic acid 6-phosphate etherase
VAASGRTPYCIGALEYAKTVGAFGISLACNIGATISKYADVAIEIDTGPEVIMGSTRMKAGTAEKLALNMISTAVMIKLGRTYDNLMIKINCRNHKGQNRTLRLFREATGIDDLGYAQQALDNADGFLEIAVLIELSGAQKDAAKKALDACGGHFNRALIMLRDGSS